MYPINAFLLFKKHMKNHFTPDYEEFFLLSDDGKNIRHQDGSFFILSPK